MHYVLLEVGRALISIGIQRKTPIKSRPRQATIHSKRSHHLIPPLAEMNISLCSPVGFKGNRFHYWKYVYFFQGS